MNSDWFHTLSASTQYAFFYNLLIQLLEGQVARQRAILDSEPFQLLSRPARARLWRQVGIEHLLEPAGQPFASECLQEAIRLSPNDRKSRYLFWTVSHLGKPVAESLLRAWRLMLRITRSLQKFGRRGPKPVPVQLSLPGK
jgi:hypothetical protein